ncbi:MAG: right-handed parallel beta-helix repeat-containing protein [bacterium]|nr:right-handed parallel beta-helix repeat-containing protein [bacterium]
MNYKKPVAGAAVLAGVVLVGVIATASLSDNDATVTTTMPDAAGDATTSTAPAIDPSAPTSTTTTEPPFDYVVASESDFAAAPAGAKILVQPGVYNVSVAPQAGQAWLCEEGAIFDGEFDHEYAFFSAAPDVSIDGCEIRNYDTPLQEGAIFGRIPNHTDGGWVVSNVWIHHNTATGIKLSGNNAQLLNSHIEWNDQMGFGMLHGSDQLVEGNEINNNNPGDRHEWGWEAGGSKNWGTIRLTIRGNVSHENHGPGIWSDWNNIDTLYEGNVVYGNVGAPGIFHEISYEAIIRDNEIFENGFPDGLPGRPFRARSGIHVAGSRGVEIYDNHVYNNAKGITGVEQCRSSSSDEFAESDGPWRLTDVVVHDNIIEDSGLSVAKTDCDYPIDMQFFDNEWIGSNTTE